MRICMSKQGCTTPSPLFRRLKTNCSNPHGPLTHFVDNDSHRLLIEALQCVKDEDKENDIASFCHKFPFKNVLALATMDHAPSHTSETSSPLAWASVISEYAHRENDMERPLWMYECMQTSGISPNSYVFVILLKACGSKLELRQGMKVHGDVVIHGLESNLFVGSTLVSMYGRCGAVVDAEHTFSDLEGHNTATWNAMLSAYVEQRQKEKALLLYRQMDEYEGVDMDWWTFIMAIHACECLEIGLSLHSNASRKLGSSNAFVGTALVRMYGKQGAIHEAEHVMQAISQPDVAAWNALLSVYVDNGKAKDALRAYIGMQRPPYQVSPDHLTFVVAFQACGVVAQRSQAHALLQIAHALNADACKHGFTFNVFVSSSLMAMYSKCQAIIDTEHVFSSLLHRNIVSWNAMLSALIGNDEPEMALLLYRQMQNDGIGFDEFTLMYALQACGILGGKLGNVSLTGRRLPKQGWLNIGRALHADAGRKGLASSDFVGNALVSMYSRCGSIVEAQYVFTTLSHSDVVSWNSTIAAFSGDNQGAKALQLYKQMQSAGVCPDSLTFVTMLQACGALLAALGEKDDLRFVGKQPNAICLEIMKALYADMSSRGLRLDAFLCSSLVTLYAKCGSVTDAEIVFRIPMLLHETVTWNAMLSAYVGQGHSKKALDLYREMHDQQVAFDNVTFVCILQACAAIGSLDLCHCINCDAVCAGYDRFLQVAPTMLRAYGSCGTTIETQISFNELPKPDIPCWNACIAAYVGSGDSNASLWTFEEMLMATRDLADETTLSLVLSACSHAGEMYGIDYLQFVERDYCISPDSQHYGIIVDLLGRAGDFKRLEKVLQRTVGAPEDLTLWLCVLTACKRHHGHLELAKCAFEHAVSLHPKQDVAYILMSNIYIDSGMLAHAEQVDNLRSKNQSFTNMDP